MSRWSEHNFDSDPSLDFMGRLTTDLVKKIEDIFRDKDQIIGETAMVAIIDILITLCKGYPEFLPFDLQDRNLPIASWKSEYLAIYDEVISTAYDEELAKDRREVIVRTFDELETLVTHAQ